MSYKEGNTGILDHIVNFAFLQLIQFENLKIFNLTKDITNYSKLIN